MGETTMIMRILRYLLNLYLSGILMELLPSLNQTFSRCLSTSQYRVYWPETTINRFIEFRPNGAGKWDSIEISHDVEVDKMSKILTFFPLTADFPSNFPFSISSMITPFDEISNSSGFLVPASFSMFLLVMGEKHLGLVYTL